MADDQPQPPLLHLISTTPLLDAHLPKRAWHALALTCTEGRRMARSLDRVVTIRGSSPGSSTIPTRFPSLRTLVLNDFHGDPAFVADIPTLQVLRVYGDSLPASARLLPRAAPQPLQKMSVIGCRVDSALATWLRFAAAWPALGELRLQSHCELGQDLAVLSALSRLRFVEVVYSPFDEAGVVALAALTGLEMLSLVGCRGVTAAGLASWTALPLLRHLTIMCSPKVDDALVMALAALTGLTHLGLRCNGHLVTAAGLAALTSLLRLQDLEITGSPISDAGAAALAAMTDLRRLSAAYCRIGDSGVAALTGLSRLRDLDLASNRVSNAGVSALAALTGLEKLRITSCLVTAAGAMALRALAHLQELDVSHNKVGGVGMGALAALTSLTKLSAHACGVTGEAGAAALTSLTALSCLQHLNVGFNNVGDAGAAALAALTSLTYLGVERLGITATGAAALTALSRLRVLTVYYNPVGDAGVVALGALPSLETLGITGCEATAAGATALKACRPGLVLEM